MFLEPLSRFFIALPSQVMDQVWMSVEREPGGQFINAGKKWT
jgi:hypothetical protein